MAFPNTQLSWTAEAALGADLTANPSTWAWTDVTIYVRVTDQAPVRITHGSPDGAIQTQPDTVTFTVDNRDGRWCAYNPSGAWFGQIGRGTPIRFTVNEGTASIRITAFIAALPPKWDVSENNRYVAVIAAGTTRRLGRGATPLRSALTRTISRTSTPPKAYWPGEDGSSATTLAEFTGNAPMTWVNTLTPASDGPDGSQSLPEFTSAAGVNGVVPAHASTGHWSVAEVLNFPAAVTADTTILRWFTSGTLPMWQLVLSPGATDTIAVEAYDAAGVRQLNNVSVFQINEVIEPYGYWVMYIAAVSQNGANIDYAAGWFLRNTGTGATGSIAGTVGTVQSIGLPASAKLDGIHAGHWAVWDIDLDPFGSSSIDTFAMDGFTGETSAVRASRLGGEEGIDVEVDSGTEETMGPQSRSTLLDTLRECAAVSDGRLFDNRDPTDFNALLRMKWHTDIENADVVMALNHNSGHIQPGFEPEDDDQKLRNDWTATRTAGSITGSSGHAVATDGHLTPALVGTYDDSVSVNVELDADLVNQAGWRVRLGTVEGLRFPQIALNFARSPSLIPTWITCEIGSRVTITNPPAGIPPDTIDVVIEGWTETIGPWRWDVVLNCSPFAPYRVGQLAATSGDTDDFLGWLDWDSCTLTTAVNSSATTMAVTVFPTDSTTADDFPRPVTIGGESVSVTASAKAVNDTFTRSVSSGWGTATSGQTYTLQGTAADFNVSGTQGTIQPSATGSRRSAQVDSLATDFDLQVEAAMNATPASGTNSVGLLARFTDTDNYYLARIQISTTGTVTLFVDKRVAAVTSTITSVLTGLTHTNGVFKTIRFQGIGTALKAKVWNTAGVEPPGWTLTTTDTSVTTGTIVAPYAINNTAVTTHVMTFDNFEVISRRTWTVTRSVNGVSKSQAAGAAITLAKPLVLTL